MGGFANTHGKGNGYVGKSTAGLVGLRARWAERANDALSDANEQARIDHRSYADRGIQREAQPKLGAAKWVKERIGEVRDQVHAWHQVRHRNGIRHGLEQIETGKPKQECEAVARAVENRRRAHEQRSNGLTTSLKEMVHEHMHSRKQGYQNEL